MGSDLTPAIWNGPFDAHLANGGTLKIGEEHPVTEEDLKSDHWIRVGEAPEHESGDAQDADSGDTDGEEQDGDGSDSAPSDETPEAEQPADGAPAAPGYPWEAGS